MQPLVAAGLWFFYAAGRKTERRLVPKQRQVGRHLVH
jgi:hypothetical protein